MRYVIYGAGAIGGGIGGRLHQHGHEVVLIARGAHLDAIRERGLRMRTPEEDARLPVPAVGHPAEVDWRPDDVVLLTMKSQDTERALDDLEAAAGSDVPVICAQNGVANERTALRRFARVYAMLVHMPATYLEAGEIIVNGAPISGVLDLGRYPSGVDALAEQVAADLEGSRFLSNADPAVMRLKYAKLLLNLGNGVQSLCGTGARPAELTQLMQAEAVACYDAAGIDYITFAEFNEQRGRLLRFGEIPGAPPRAGGSTWQSVMRGQTSIEVDYLNGETVLLGALHGVPTPYNRLVQVEAKRAARERLEPGFVTVDVLIERGRALAGAEA